MQNPIEETRTSQFLKITLNQKYPYDYIVIDLCKNGDIHYTDTPPDLTKDACRTSELWLRHIPASNENSISDFYLAIFPITQRQWELVMNDTPSFFKESGPGAPVDSVSYEDAHDFIRYLSVPEGLKFTLPSVEQWKYACSARTSGYPQKYECKHHDSPVEGTHTVGMRQPNAWGLFDMLDNVGEWTSSSHCDYSRVNWRLPREAKELYDEQDDDCRGNWMRHCILERNRALGMVADCMGSRINCQYDLSARDKWVGMRLAAVFRHSNAPWKQSMSEHDCISIPLQEGITEINEEAFSFSNYHGISGIIIPEGITSLGPQVFKNCLSLTSVIFPNGVTVIGAQAFDGCTALSDVKLPEGLTKIGARAFQGCTGLTSVSIPDSVTEIGEGAFSGCTGLTSVVIPGSVTEIGDRAFQGCTGLTSVSIPDGVTRIGVEAFSKCTGLTSVVIPGSVTEIGDRAFDGCTGLTSVSIPDSVTEIGDRTFSGCTGLTSVVIPDSVTEIGDRAFSGCTGLTSVVIPDGVTRIGVEAFSECTGLTSVVIPDSVTEIGYFAFYGCTGLTSVVIPDGVTEVGEGAFDGCTGLPDLRIPESVKLGLPYVIIPPSRVTEVGEGASAGGTGKTDNANQEKQENNQRKSKKHFWEKDITPIFIVVVVLIYLILRLSKMSKDNCGSSGGNQGQEEERKNAAAVEYVK